MDFNATDANGMTAFHYACVHGRLPEIKLILTYAQELGINLGTDNMRGETPLTLARKNQYNIENMKTDILPVLESALNTRKSE